VAQALESEYVAERGGISDYAYPQGGAARMVTAPIRFPGVELPTNAAPSMGAHTVEQLRAAGYSDEKIAALNASGAIALKQEAAPASDAIKLAASG
jgi:crotonobetainyl-CoA:carnitine CoA-transferase CaiB-like acyl-CoA transferase